MHSHRTLQYVHSVMQYQSCKATDECFTKVTSQNDTTTLLGSTRRDYYDILKWMSFANSDFLPSIGGCILPLIGRKQPIRKNTEDCLRALYQHCKLTDNHLKWNRYLIGERLSVADFFMVAMLEGAFMVFHKVLHTDYKAMTRWFYDVYNTPIYRDIVGELPLLDVPFPTLPTDENPAEQGKPLEVQQDTAVAA